ncbi:MAG TPA: hypothetical protein V6D05_15100 [Stenomitos sp.]
MNHLGCVALVAILTSGCTAADFAMPTGAMGSWGAPNSLVDSSPRGGGGTTPTGSTINGATVALFQTSIGPIAWKGVQLAQMQSTGTTLLWNAPPDRNNQALAIPQSGLAWAVGYGVARYQNSEWNSDVTDVDAVATPTTASSQRVLLTDVSFAPGSSTVGYAVGTRGTILRYNGVDRWTKVTDAGLTTENLGTVKVLAPNDVWVAGQVLMHYNGNEWTKVTTVPGEISGLAVVDAHNVWASTGSGLYQWDGSADWTAWTAKFVPTGKTVGAPRIAAFGNTVVGLAIEPGVPSGAVFTYRNGTWQTETVTVPADVGLDTVVLASQNLAYAKTYDNSGVYRFDLTSKTWSYYSE